MPTIGDSAAMVPVKTQHSQGFAQYRGTRGRKPRCRARPANTVCRQQQLHKPARHGASLLYLALHLRCPVCPSGLHDLAPSARPCCTL